jgi:hypothetical protein
LITDKANPELKKRDDSGGWGYPLAPFLGGGAPCHRTPPIRTGPLQRRRLHYILFFFTFEIPPSSSLPQPSRAPAVRQAAAPCVWCSSSSVHSALSGAIRTFQPLTLHFHIEFHIDNAPRTAIPLEPLPFSNTALRESLTLGSPGQQCILKADLPSSPSTPPARFRVCHKYI